MISLKHTYQSVNSDVTRATICTLYGLRSKRDVPVGVLKQGYRYHKLRKAFSKFYRRHYELISKYNVGLKSFYIKGDRNQNFMVT